jgi:hypothetical protein
MNRRPLLILLLIAIAAMALLLSDVFDGDSGDQPPLSAPDAAETDAEAEPADLPMAQPDPAVNALVEAASESAAAKSNREEVASLTPETGAEADQPLDEFLRVLVHDPEGQPLATVPVSLWTMSRGRYYPWKEVGTLEDGIATFDLPPLDGADDLKLAVGFKFPYVGSKTVQLKRSALPAEPISLSLEATGSIAVQLIGPDDQPWPYATEVRLVPAPGFFERKSKALQKFGPGYGSQESNAEGQVVFPFVAIKKQYVVGVQYNSWGKWQRRNFAAPAKAGGKVEIVLRLIEPVPMVRFRLLDPDGAPVNSRDWFGVLSQFDLSNGGMSSRGSSANSNTDADGYTLFPINVNQRLDSWTLRQLTLNCRVPDTGPMLHARVDLTRKLNPGVQDIGDVQLLKFKLLASGRILSDRGTPVEGVSLTMEEQTVITGPESQSEHWDYLSGATQVKADGSFTVSGSSSTTALKLTFEADGYHPLVQEVAVGSSGHQFQFEASFVISGQLILAEGSAPQRARLIFVPSGSMVTGSMSSGNISHAVIKEDGHFMISGLKNQTPGEIAVFYGSGETALARIPEVSPLPVDAAPDPRLNPLRIGEMHHYEVSFVNSAGNKVRNVQYLLFANPAGQELGLGKQLRDSTVFNNRLELQSPLDHFKVGYYAEGYQYGEIEIEPGETVVTLKTAVMATLRLDNTLELPPGTELRIELESDAAMGLVNDGVTLPAFIPTVLPIVPIPAAGTYHIKLRLKDIESNKSILVSWPDGAETLDFEVGEHEGQEFNASFPNQQIREAAEKLKAGN